MFNENDILNYQEYIILLFQIISFYYWFGIFYDNQQITILILLVLKYLFLTKTRYPKIN